MEKGRILDGFKNSISRKQSDELTPTLQLLPGKTPEFFDSETAAVVAMKKSVFLQCLALNIIDGKETRPTNPPSKNRLFQPHLYPFFKGKLITE